MRFSLLIGAVLCLGSCVPPPAPPPGYALILGYATADAGKVQLEVDGKNVTSEVLAPGVYRARIHAESAPQYPDPAEAPEHAACIERSAHDFEFQAVANQVYRLSLSPKGRCVHELSLVRLKSAEGPDGEVVTAQSKQIACTRRCSPIAYLSIEGRL